ncbi:MAG: DUF108 domain-containing protein [Gammaproteobacteria bacterium]|nr:DUF108 domain-containing protein [Gammaproteobacteria bacterium]
MSSRPRIGLLGFGFVGGRLYNRLTERHPEIEIGFVYNRSRAALTGLPQKIILDDPGIAAQRGCDLIVEMAHPSITEQYGLDFLKSSDYMPLSVNGLADTALLGKLLAAAEQYGHRLLIPHGALMGCDNLIEWKHIWQEVCITMRKHPKHLNIPNLLDSAGADDKEITLYDGPVAGIANKFPRNVNAMVACALATVGVDRCRGRLIASEDAEYATLEVSATGKDGSKLQMKKEAPMVGVSGAEMFESQYRSALKALGLYQTLDFV